MTPAQRRELVDRRHGSLSIVRQCALLDVSRSSLYHRPKETSQQALSLDPHSFGGFGLRVMI